MHRNAKATGHSNCGDDEQDKVNKASTAGKGINELIVVI